MQMFMCIASVVSTIATLGAIQISRDQKEQLNSGYVRKWIKSVEPFHGHMATYHTENL